MATIGLVLTILAGTASAQAPGAAAPAFTINDTAGKPVALADFKGKYVVLEWTNPGCPFVQKHYVSDNMQSLQRDAKAKGVVWLAINSTEPKHQDYLAPAKLATKMNTEWKAAASDILMDESGKVGMAYGAKTTPHMYVIDPAGKLVYAGGIDDKRSANPADVKIAKNYVRAALDDALAGKAIAVATSTPYGCSVKYP